MCTIAEACVVVLVSFTLQPTTWTTSRSAWVVRSSCPPAASGQEERESVIQWPATRCLPRDVLSTQQQPADIDTVLFHCSTNVSAPFTHRALRPIPLCKLTPPGSPHGGEGGTRTPGSPGPRSRLAELMLIFLVLLSPVACIVSCVCLSLRCCAVSSPQQPDEVVLPAGSIDEQLLLLLEYDPAHSDLLEEDELL